MPTPRRTTRHARFNDDGARQDINPAGPRQWDIAMGMAPPGLMQAAWRLRRQPSALRIPRTVPCKNGVHVYPLRISCRVRLAIRPRHGMHQRLIRPLCRCQPAADTWPPSTADLRIKSSPPSKFKSATGGLSAAPISPNQALGPYQLPSSQGNRNITAASEPRHPPRPITTPRNAERAEPLSSAMGRRGDTPNSGKCREPGGKH